MGEEMEITFYTLFDEEYPARLKEIPDAPGGIYTAGSLPGEELSVAVIGARDCSEYGKYVAERLGVFLGERNVTVISGMARGIDGIAQEAALKAGGNSCGVLGCGLDICYPAQNRRLYEMLLERGSLVSEYPPGMPALPRNFPRRNRIVSGLADAVVVVEARQRSGTLITVDTALEQGKEVYVVPGRITDRLSDGCNRLLKQGAGLLLSFDDFLEELDMLTKRIKKQDGRQAGAEKERRDGQAGAEKEQNEPRKRQGRKRRGDAGRGKDKEKEGKAEGNAERDGGAVPGELLPVYRALDFYPRSMEQIMAQLSRKIPQKQLAAQLIRLCAENQAVQVSPGHFIRRG